MLHLEDGLEAKIYEITLTYLEEVQQILNKFDKIVSKGLHDIENCLIIKHIIRLITDVPVVGKKNKVREGMDRLCVNYKLLNKITILDRYPLPNINETCSRF